MNNMGYFIGVKQVLAKPMGKANFIRYTDPTQGEMTIDDSAQIPGYLVEYLDGGKANHPQHAGYISWSPKDVFERAYRATSAMPYGMALEAMRQGQRVSRLSWGDVWVAVGGTPVVLEAEKFWNPHSRAHAIAQGGTAVVEPYFIMKTARQSIQMGWAPDQADSLAEDWVILPNELNPSTETVTE